MATVLGVVLVYRRQTWTLDVILVAAGSVLVILAIAIGFVAP